MSIFKELKNYLRKSGSNCIRFDTKIKGVRIPTYVFLNEQKWVLVILSKSDNKEVYRESEKNEVVEMLKNYSWQKSNIESASEDIDISRVMIE